MKERILKLQAEGVSYRDIAKQVGCAVSTVWYYCTHGAKQKRQSYNTKRTQKLKHDLKMSAGGKCQCCGYDRCLDALDFHHLDDDKAFNVMQNTNRLSWSALSKEIQKCLLVCSNCHREIHAGIRIVHK